MSLYPLVTPTVAMATGFTTEQWWLCQMRMWLAWKQSQRGCRGYAAKWNHTVCNYYALHGAQLCVETLQHACVTGDVQSPLFLAQDSGRLIDRRSHHVHRTRVNALEAHAVPLVPPWQNNCVITQTIPPGFRTMQGQINACWDFQRKKEVYGSLCFLFCFFFFLFFLFSANLESAFSFIT